MSFLSVLFVCGSLALLITVQYADGIECYSCTGPKCTEYMFRVANVENNIIECTGSCSKTVGINNAVTRGCLPTIKKDRCEGSNYGNQCYCDEDLCNGSEGLHASFTYIAVAVVTVASFICL